MQLLDRDLDSWELEQLLSGKYDNSGCRLTIMAGAGGTEAQDWALMLQRMYLRYFERRGFKYKIIEEEVCTGEYVCFVSVVPHAHPMSFIVVRVNRLPSPNLHQFIFMCRERTDRKIGKQGTPELQQPADEFLSSRLAVSFQTLSSITRLPYQAGEVAGIKSCEMVVEGEFAYGYLAGEKGTHRLVRQSPFNAQAKRQTSFAGVESFPIIEQADLS